MMELVKELKIRPSKLKSRKGHQRFIIQNRGLNLIGKQIYIGNAKGKLIPGLQLMTPNPANPDAILWENAFTAKGSWADAKEKDLLATQNGHCTTVIALGYKETFKDKQQFFNKCEKLKLVPSWATSSFVLHKELTISP